MRMRPAVYDAGPAPTTPAGRQLARRPLARRRNRGISLTLYAECMNPDLFTPRDYAMPTFWRAGVLLQLMVVSYYPVSAYCFSLNYGCQVGIPSHPGPTPVPSAGPVYDYHACIGHYCADCEFASSKIVHPPSGSHSGNKEAGSVGVKEYRMRYHSDTFDGNCFENLLESDYIYFDPYRDVDLAWVINDTMQLKYQVPVPS